MRDSLVYYCLQLQFISISILLSISVFAHGPQLAPPGGTYAAAAARSLMHLMHSSCRDLALRRW